MINIYPSITTTDRHYLEKLNEINSLGLSEVCFFATQIPLSERKDFYKHLENSTVKHIPLVHIKEDMEEWELEFFLNKFKTKTFNCHPQDEHPLKNNLLKYKDIIFVENTFYPLKESDIKKFGGICFDFSHLETMRISSPSVFKSNMILIDKYKIGCSHISAKGVISDLSVLRKIPKYFPFLGKYLKNKYSAHILKNLKN